VEGFRTGTDSPACRRTQRPLLGHAGPRGAGPAAAGQRPPSGSGDQIPRRADAHQVHASGVRRFAIAAFVRGASGRCTLSLHKRMEALPLGALLAEIGALRKREGGA